MIEPVGQPNGQEETDSQHNFVKAGQSDTNDVENGNFFWKLLSAFQNMWTKLLAN